MCVLPYAHAHSRTFIVLGSLPSYLHDVLPLRFFWVPVAAPSIRTCVQPLLGLFVIASQPRRAKKFPQSIKNLTEEIVYKGCDVFTVEKAHLIKQGSNTTGTRVLIDPHLIDKRIRQRNSLRKNDAKPWTSVIPTVDVYTIDFEFVINRNKPMTTTRILLG